MKKLWVIFAMINAVNLYLVILHPILFGWGTMLFVIALLIDSLAAIYIYEVHNVDSSEPVLLVCVITSALMLLVLGGMTLWFW